MASVARIYLRLATLFPDQVDLRQTTNDIAQLADVLDTCECVLCSWLTVVPGVHFAQHLRHVVRKARRKGVFAPTSSHVRPHMTQLPSSTALSDVRSVGSTGSHQGPTTQSPLDFDIFLAEQMLNTNNVAAPPPPDASDPFAGMFDTGVGAWDTLGLSGISGDTYSNPPPVYGVHPGKWHDETWLRSTGSSGEFTITDFTAPTYNNQRM